MSSGLDTGKAETVNQWADDPAGRIISSEVFNQETSIDPAPLKPLKRCKKCGKVNCGQALPPAPLPETGNYELASLDNHRNDGDVLSDDLHAESPGGLNHERSNQEASTPDGRSEFSADPGPDSGLPPGRSDFASINRSDDEVKNGSNIGNEDKDYEPEVPNQNDSNSDDSFDNWTGLFGDGPQDELSSFCLPVNRTQPDSGSSELAQSARLSAPANAASFDAQDYGLPHVQNDQENNRSATCAESPKAEEKPTAYKISDLASWAIKNYAVDPVQNSKNRWRIRIRCRKAGCAHSDHLKLKTVSFMSDSAYRKLSRSKRKYELWKKATIAENARALR